MNIRAAYLQRVSRIVSQPCRWSRFTVLSRSITETRLRLRVGHSPGVFLVRQRIPVAAVAEALVLIWVASDASEWENLILEIPF